MTELVASGTALRRGASAVPLFWSLVWRNLWRNARRSRITIGGIAFAMVMLVFVPSAQFGMFGQMIENATRQVTGHVQVQRRGYLDDARLESTVPGFSELRELLLSAPHVLAVGGRANAFVLASAHDRSVGVQLVGVMPDVEKTLSSLPEQVVEGRYIEGEGEAVAGRYLVHNLGLTIGDEIVILGTAVGGGVAALVLHLVGIFDTGQSELDRTLLQVDLASFADAFALHDEVHAVVVRLDGFDRARAWAADIDPELAADLVALPWSELIPEVEDTIELKHAGARFLYVVLVLLVVFSVVNTFMMTVYERTRELGMLLAIGMRRSRIVGMLHAEALLLTLVGVVFGLAIGGALVVVLSRVGITVGNDIGDILRQYHMPDRLRPALDVASMLWATVAMLVATQVAAAVATNRVRNLTPIDALRNPDLMHVPVTLLVTLGWRNIWRHRRRNGMLFGAIFVAVAGVVFANALIRGYQHDLADDAVGNMTGHIKALATGYLADPSIEKSFELSPDWRPALPAAEVFGWTARVRVPAVVLSERETRGVSLVGIDPVVEAKLSFLGNVAIDGHPLENATDGRLLLGKALADQLGTAPGRRVVVMSQGSDGRTREAGFRVAGTFDAEGTGLEKAFAFTGVRTLQDMLDAQGVTEVSVTLTDDRFRAAAVAAMRGTLGTNANDVVVLDWRELEPQMAAMVQFADSAILIWLVIMLLALAFGLVNTLITAVMERIRELGMLRAIGMRRSAVVVQVVIESCLIVLVGVGLGVVAGVGLVWLVHDGIDLSAWSAGIELAGLRSILTPRLLATDIVLVIGVSLVLGLVASLYPAWQAVKMSPLDALRR